MIVARDLDGAGVPQWFARLSAARKAGNVAYDRAWAEIKREYDALMEGKTVEIALPADSPRQARDPSEPERVHVPSYSEIYESKETK